MTNTTPTVFDAATYKTTTRAQWEDAAEAWHRWAPALEAWLGEATELMLDLADVGNGARVLDVAAGAGGQTLAAARRVGATGVVLATDISPGILRFAESEADPAADCRRSERESFGALPQMLSGLDDAGREAAWTEIADQLRQFEGADGFVGPCELLVAAGRRPE